MVLTRLEKIAFAALIVLLGLGIILLIGKVGTSRSKNRILAQKIEHISALTDQTVLVKGDGFDEQENAGKLNLNRTDLKSIRALPGMTAPLSKKIYDFIQKKGEIKDMKELLDIKGLTRRRIRQLENYATVIGGHSGQAAWGDKLNLNFATVEDIRALGISRKAAKAIIDFRNRNGGFFSLDDLKEIPGVGAASIKKIKDRVEVR